MLIVAILIPLLFIVGLAFSFYRFYKEKSYKVMLSFTALGLIFGYYFKGLTEARLTTSSTGTEGIFLAFTVFLIMVINGVVAQFLSIMLKKPHSKNKKIAYSIGGVFIIVTLFMMLQRLL